MKRKTTARALMALGALTTAAALSAASGCNQTGRGYIHVGSIEDTATRVFDRHDSYVQQDSTLSQVERDTFLRSTQELRSVLDSAREGADASSGG